MICDDLVHRLFVPLVRAAIGTADPPRAARLTEALRTYEANPGRRTVEAFQRFARWGAPEAEMAVSFTALAVANRSDWYDNFIGPWAETVVDLVGEQLDEADRVALRLLADGMEYSDALTAAELILSPRLRSLDR